MLTRMGFGPANGPFLSHGDAKKPAVVELLGLADRTIRHPSDIPCVDQAGRARPDVTRSVQWGDLTVAFTADDTMVGYIYGPPATGRPAATYESVTLGAPMSAVLATSTAVQQLAGKQEPYGWPWRVRGQSSIGGFSDGPTSTAKVTMIHAGTPCFGVPAP